MIYCCILVVWTFNNCVHWACILTVTAIYAFCHVYVVSSRSSWTIWTRFALDCYCVCWTSCSTKFASNTSSYFMFVPLLSCSVSTKCMFSSESWRDGSLFIGIVDCPFRFEGVKECAEEHRIVIFRTDPLNKCYDTPL